MAKRYDPRSPDYCIQCDADAHTCNQCGLETVHNEHVCEDCQDDE